MNSDKYNLTFWQIGAVAVGIVAVSIWMWRAPLEVAAPVIDQTVEVPVAAATAPDPGPMLPVFDTFRVEPDGAMVVAGRADPGAVVDIVVGDRAIERLVADDAGAFAAFPQLDPSDDPRVLSLLLDPDGAALPSEKTYIIAPIAAPVAPQIASDNVDLVQVTDGGDAPALPDPAAAPAVLAADADGVRVVQEARDVPPEVSSNVALDTITYNPSGEVAIAGRAQGAGAVRVYLDNEPLTNVPIAGSGDWQVDLPDVDTGIYTLRIDEVDAAGDVVSRIETPFKREEPAAVAAVLAEEVAQDGFDVAVKTVQPGATLWAIAQENLGDGVLYVSLFEANRDLIKDPDLIYPGQVFRIPEVE